MKPATARPQKSTLNNLLTLKSIIQQRKHEEKGTYVAFINIEEAYDKVWSKSKFSFCWNFCVQGNHKVSVYTQAQQIVYILLQKELKLYTIFLHLDSILAPNLNGGLKALPHTI